MDITIGSIDMFRTNPAHAGKAKLRETADSLNIQNQLNIKNFPSKADAVNGQKTKTSFESYLLEAMNGMNSQQLKVGQLTEQAITDPDSVDIHDVTIAMAKAQSSLSLAQTVIDRLVSGWQELSQNR